MSQAQDQGSLRPTNTSAMDNAIWELREVYRCIGARLVKIQNKRAVYGPVPAPVDPASFISEPFSALRTSRSGVSPGLVNELIEEMDIAVLALRLCCVRIEIEREGLRGLLPLPPTTTTTTTTTPVGDRGEGQGEGKEGLGGRTGPSNGQASSVLSMAERPHPLTSSNRDSHGSSNREYVDAEQMEGMKKGVSGTMELVSKAETGTGVGETVPYEANNAGRRGRTTQQRGSYTPTFGCEDYEARKEQIAVGVEKKPSSRRQPGQAPAHPPPARTTSLALPRSKAGANRKTAGTGSVVTKGKSPGVVPSAPGSTPAPNNATNKNMKPQDHDNGLHDGGNDVRQQRDAEAGESASRIHYHRQQVARAHAQVQVQVQVHHTQETHQHRISTGTEEAGSSSNTTRNNRGHFDETKETSIRPPTTSKYNKPIFEIGPHSPSLIPRNNGNSTGYNKNNNNNLNSIITNSTTAAPSCYKYSQSHHHKKNIVKGQCQNVPRENEESESKEHNRADPQEKGSGDGGGGLQQEHRSPSFLGTVKGAIKGVFNGTMT